MNNLKILTIWQHEGTVYIRYEGTTRALYFRGMWDFEEAKKVIMEKYVKLPVFSSPQ